MLPVAQGNVTLGFRFLLLIRQHKKIHRYILQLFNLTLDYAAHLNAEQHGPAQATATKFATANRYLMIVLSALRKTGAAPHLHDVIAQLNFNDFFTNSTE